MSHHMAVGILIYCVTSFGRLSAVEFSLKITSLQIVITFLTRLSGHSAASPVTRPGVGGGKKLNYTV